MGINLKLSRVKQRDLIAALDWRENDFASLRTSHFILDSAQSEFYQSLKNRTDIQYFSVINDKKIVGVCGFVNLNLVNRNGEIAMILNPKFRGDGYGLRTLDLLLIHGFNNLGLKNIYGETYECNPSYGFWENIIKQRKVTSVRLPERKFYEGKFWDGIYFNFSLDNYL